MSTYSVYNIKVDNLLSFTPGATAGYVLTIDANGSTYWSAGGSGGSTSSSMIKVTNVTLATASWFVSGSYYGYTYSNANITTSSNVDFTPYNTSVDAVIGAQVLPYIMATTSAAVIYSRLAPTASIVGDIIIWK